MLTNLYNMFSYYMWIRDHFWHITVNVIIFILNLMRLYRLFQWRCLNLLIYLILLERFILRHNILISKFKYEIYLTEILLCQFSHQIRVYLRISWSEIMILWFSQSNLFINVGKKLFIILIRYPERIKFSSQIESKILDELLFLIRSNVLFKTAF